MPVMIFRTNFGVILRDRILFLEYWIIIADRSLLLGLNLRLSHLRYVDLSAFRMSLLRISLKSCLVMLLLFRLVVMPNFV